MLSRVLSQSRDRSVTLALLEVGTADAWNAVRIRVCCHVFCRRIVRE